MSRFASELDNKSFVIRLQWAFIAILAAICLMAILGWRASPKDLTVHVPPDLRSGVTLKPGEVPLPNIYAFSYYIWQQINRWPESGDKDYGAAIFKVQAYLTPACLVQVQADMNRKSANGELTLRTRALQEIPGHGYEEARVQPVAQGVWRVTLDTEIMETVRGVRVKDAMVRYPLRVVRFEGDREANPFGLAIDCYGDSDKPLSIDEEVQAERKALQEANTPRVRVQ